MPVARVLEGHEEIRDAYRDEHVARCYIDERFRQPLGALLHARQAAHLVRLIRTLRPHTLLEVAPGPARLTVEVARVHRGSGIVIDASAPMLDEARRRLEAVARGRWRFVQGDVFSLPISGTVDLVYAFRLIRHFDREDRRRIYAQIRGVLPPGGLLVFDAINKDVAAAVRARSRECHHYDALLTSDELRSELGECGFDLVSLTGVQNGYPLLYRLQVLLAPRSPLLARAALSLVDRLGSEPLEWIVTCRRP
ncbi:MAG: methyltransferase domain-containing protein [Acidobacteria bacterium]|nr:methyltransferase domain-containing protein [Acidobacteriota bacterium]